MGIGETLVYDVRATATVPKFTWMVMGRGRVETGGELDGGATELRFETTAAMAPKARLVLYAVLPGNREILVDAVDFNVDGLFKNKVRKWRI